VPSRCGGSPLVPHLLDDGEQVEGAARKAVDARHRHHVAGGEVLEHFEKLAAVVVRARDLLAVNPAAPFGAQLLKLRIERLSVGAHAGISETPVFGGWLGLGFEYFVPVISYGKRKRGARVEKQTVMTPLVVKTTMVTPCYSKLTTACGT
jgi:hypothetical protein